MAAGVTYEPIATYTTSGGDTNHTFSVIPQTYTDLILVFKGSMSTFGGIWMRVGNGSVDSGANYSGQGLYSPARYGNDTNVYGINELNKTEYQALGWGVGIGAYESVCRINIANYSNTTTYKTIIGRSDSSFYGVQMNVGTWRSTAAINTIYLFATGGNITNGSTFTLYGIAAA